MKGIELHILLNYFRKVRFLCPQCGDSMNERMPTPWQNLVKVSGRSADKPKLFYIAFVITIGLKKRILNRVCPTEAVVGGRHRIFLFYDTPEITESIVDFFGLKMDF